MKLTTICDVSHLISYTSLFLSWGHRVEGQGTKLAHPAQVSECCVRRNTEESIGLEALCVCAEDLIFSAFR